MGNTLTAEFPSSWDEPEVKKWQKESRERQKCIYLQFEGSAFHDITDLSEPLRITKICFAIYGPPQEKADDLESAYTTDQRAFAEKIYDKIHEVKRQAPEKRFKLGFVFLFCKEQEKEYQVPLFRLLWEYDGKLFNSRYIDTSGRVYNTAQDWKNNNTMPMMKYCHPTDLFYSCNIDYTDTFDSEKDPVVTFNTSPCCDLSARILRTADVLIGAIGMTVGVVALFSPAGFISAPILLGVGGTSGAYGFGRSVQRLIDKGSHGESLTDLESVLLYLSILASPLHLLNGYATAKLASGAAAGRIFTMHQRMLATLLMWSVLGLDSFALILNLSNLIQKYDDGKLGTLDVLQFSVSTLFFANTLIQPRTAHGVIERAQQQRIGAIARGMTDESAKEAFKSFLEKNEKGGGIQNTSKTIRTLNKMEDPNAFFKNSGHDVTIGGRKGNTVLVNDGNKTTRVNPNKFVRDKKIEYTNTTQGLNGMPKIEKRGKLTSCLGGVEVEDHKYMKNMDAQQMGRVNKVFGGAAKYNETIVHNATKLADMMPGKVDPDTFMSLVEIVTAKTKQDPSFQWTDASRAAFHSDMMKDLGRVRHIAASTNVTFCDEMKALYHYRKHGNEFMQYCEPKFYLKELPNNILQTGQLSKEDTVTTRLPDGTTESFTRKTYFTPDDSMLVTIEKDSNTKLCTIMKRPGAWNQKYPDLSVPLPADSFAKLALANGMHDVARLTVISRHTTYNDFKFCNEADKKYYEAMVAILVNEMAYNLDPEED